METQKERLVKFINYLQISTRAFERSIGTAQSSVCSAKTKLSSNIIDRTCAAYPMLNRIWLLTGDGNMLIKQPVSVTEYHMPGATNTNIDSPNAIAGGDIELSMKVAELQGKLADKEAEAAELKAEIASLREENMQLKIDNARMQGRLDVLAQNK